MKKVFRMAAIAVLALGLTTACKQKAVEPEEIIDSTIEEVVEEIEEVVEDTVVVTPEEPVKKVVKKKAQSAEAKPVATTDKKSNNTITITAADGTTVTAKAPSKVEAGSLEVVGSTNTKDNKKK